MNTVILTCRRPDQLDACIDSMASALFSRGLDLRVYDDSRDPGYEEQNSRIVESQAQGRGLRIEHRRSREMESGFPLFRRLQGEAREALAFALGLWDFPHLQRCPGPVRNHILLSSAGSPILSFDDDTRYRFYSSAASRTENSPFRFYAFADRESLLRACPPANWDILSFLDQGLPEKVKSLSCGVWGGRWFPLPSTLFAARGGAELFSSALGKQQLYIHAAERSVLEEAFLITPCYYLDARQILPPFLPHIRSEDYIWALCLQQFYGEESLLQLPYAVEHDDSSHPAMEKEDFTRLDYGFTMMMEMLTTVLYRNKPGAGVSDSLDTAAAAFADLSEREDNALIAVLDMIASAFLNNRIQVLSRKPEEEKLSSAAERAVLDYTELLRCRLAEGRRWLPEPFFSRGGKEEFFPLLRNYCRGCALLFRHWERIWQAALDEKKV